MITTTEAPTARRQLSFFNLPVKETLSREDKIRESRQANTAARNQRINDRFNHLYNVERKRYDDVMNALSEEFCLALATIERVLKG